MSELPGTALAEAEEQLQAMLDTLKQFEKASARFEKGRQSLDETATQVTQLLDMAGQSLRPALEAVATLRRLDPDRLLAGVTAVASSVEQQLASVSDQLTRLEMQQAQELDKTGKLITGAVTEIQAIGHAIPDSFAKLDATVQAGVTAVASSVEQQLASVSAQLTRVEMQQAQELHKTDKLIAVAVTEIQAIGHAIPGSFVKLDATVQVAQSAIDQNRRLLFVSLGLGASTLLLVIATMVI